MPPGLDRGEGVSSSLRTDEVEPGPAAAEARPWPGLPEEGESASRAIAPCVPLDRGYTRSPRLDNYALDPLLSGFAQPGLAAPPLRLSIVDLHLG